MLIAAHVVRNHVNELKAERAKLLQAQPRLIELEHEIRLAQEELEHIESRAKAYAPAEEGAVVDAELPAKEPASPALLTGDAADPLEAAT